jgi:hypothetical protein
VSLRGVILLAGLMFGGCQAMAQPLPAVMVKADAPEMEQLRAALARAMGRASVQLGPGDPTQSSSIAVLPRPPGPQEGNSTAMPTIFRLETEGGACFVAREGGGARERVDGVQCRAAARQ